MLSFQNFFNWTMIFVVATAGILGVMQTLIIGYEGVPICAPENIFCCLDCTYGLPNHYISFS